MTTTIWLASSGSYSDYSVSCAFATYELAIAYVAARNKIPADIQRELDEADSLPYQVLKKRRRELSERSGVDLSALDWFIEERELFDALPIVEDEAR